MDWAAFAKHVLESDATIGGAFGAFFGALGAQFGISRYQTKQAVLQELNSIGAAQILCFSITNKFVAMKRQNTRSMRDRHAHARQIFDAAKAAAAAGMRPGPRVPTFEIQFDLQTLTEVKVPIEALERYVTEKISIRGRGLAAAMDLSGAIDAFSRAVAYRNGLVEESRTNGMTTAKYFGIPAADGAVDERFSSNITALYDGSDDCIFFGRILSDDLLKYGNGLRLKFRRRLYRLGVPVFQPADWSAAERDGLIPLDVKYERWLSGFKTRPTRMARLKAWLKGLAS